MKGAKSIFLICALFFAAAGVWFLKNDTVAYGVNYSRYGSAHKGLVNAPGLFFFAGLMLWLYYEVYKEQQKAARKQQFRTKAGQDSKYTAPKNRRLIRPKRNPQNTG